MLIEAMVEKRLSEELRKWKALGRVPKIWWRDDDAITHTENLEILFGMAEKFGVNLALSVIPERCNASLVRSIQNSSGICAWQHGWSHADHGGNSEFGDSRAISESIRDALMGKSRMDEMFGEDGWNPVFVPPWSSISGEFKGVLPSLGFWGASTCSKSISQPGVKEINVDIDILDWKNWPTVRFVGVRSCLRSLTETMLLRRSKNLLDLPIGLMTHHTQHDENTWKGLEEFLRFLVVDLRAEFLDVRNLLKPAP